MNKVMIASVALMILGAAAEAQAGMALSSAQPVEPGCTTTTDTDITGGRPSTSRTPSTASDIAAPTATTTSPATSRPNGSAIYEHGKTARAKYSSEVTQQFRQTYSSMRRLYASHKMRRRETVCLCGN
jgi:hypothetical protein